MPLFGFMFVIGLIWICRSLVFAAKYPDIAGVVILRSIAHLVIFCSIVCIPGAVLVGFLNQWDDVPGFVFAEAGYIATLICGSCVARWCDRRLWC